MTRASLPVVGATDLQATSSWRIVTSVRRRRWVWPFVVVTTLLVACLATAVIAIVSSTKAHFDCGGTFGGYGGAPDDNLDRACFERRQSDLMWLAGVVWIVAVGGLLLTSRLVRRAAPGADG